jgi:hypothetical protein
MCSTTLDLLHTCVCAGSHRVRVRLSGLINGRNQFHSWGFPQASHSGPSLCRTVKTIGFECGLKPLGDNNIGNGRPSSSSSLLIRPSSSSSLLIRPSSSSSLLIRPSSRSSLLIKPSSSSSLLIRPSNSTSLFLRPSGGSRQQGLFCCGDINASHQIQAGLCGAQSAKRICQP